MAEPAFVLGIDLGTSSARALVIDQTKGDVVARAHSTYPLSTPQKGWAEQNPRHWWTACCQAIKEAVKKAGLSGSDIACVGLTGQMHGLVVLDEDLKLIRPAILWNDQRTDRQCQYMHTHIGRSQLIKITGKPALTSFTAPKLLWIREHEPEAFSRIKHILLPKDAMRLHLTGERGIDVTDASGTSLLDISSRTWSRDVITALDLDESWLPPVLESSVIAGTITREAAGETGLRAGTPVVAGAGDQAAAGIACGINDDHVISVNLGTSGVVFAACDGAPTDPSGSMHTFCHAVPDTCHLMGCMLSAGGSLRWYRDAFCAGMDFDAIIHEAMTVPTDCDGLTFAPYLSGERTPHNDPTLTAAFTGITAQHTRAHFSRAVLEGILHGLRDSIDLVRAVGQHPSHVRMTGGGAQSEPWRAMAANIFGMPVASVNITDGSAYGVGLLAMVASGRFESVSEAMAACVRETSRFDPNPQQADTHANWMASTHPRRTDGT